MSSNYPPGVTGNEYAIAGPDYTQEVDGICPNCGDYGILFECGYPGDHWRFCGTCGYQEDVDPIEPDPDRERCL